MPEGGVPPDVSVPVPAYGRDMTSSLQQKVILVGWDYGERARDALALAGILARKLGLGIRVAHVYETYPAYPPYTDLTESAREVGQRMLDEVPFDGLAGIAVDKVLVSAHSPAAGLHQLAGGADVEMVVLGSTHRGALGRALPGTVASHLLHGCPCAVAIAPAGYVQRRHAATATIVAAYDASPEARAAVEEATRLARRRARSCASCPWSRRRRTDGSARRWCRPQTLPRSQSTHRGDLDEVMADRPDDIECEDVLREGPPAKELCDEAEDADLLVMGSRGYGPLRSVLLGSVSAGVVRSAPCPVLVIPRSATTERDERRAGVAVATS